MSDIGPEGAALLAQVLPVGVLIVAVERRALGSGRYPKRTIWRVLWWAQLSLIGFGTGAAVVGTMLCVIAAVQMEPLSEFAAAVTFFGGSCIGLFAINTSVRLAMRQYTAHLDDR